MKAKSSVVVCAALGWMLVIWWMGGVTGPAVRRPQYDSEESSGRVMESCRWGKYARLDEMWREELGDSRVAEPRKILFVKPQKTGGTTIASILMRYAIRQGLVVLLPLPPKAVFQNEDFILEAMDHFNVTRVDAFLSHSRYKEDLFSSYLNTTSPFRLTVVRERRSRLLSSFYYARELWESELPWFCAELSGDPQSWAEKCRTVTSYQFQYVTPSDWPIENVSISTVFDHYNHVLVTERMTESLVLLIPKMNLQLADLLTVEMKTTNVNAELSPQELELFESTVAKRSDARLLELEDEFYRHANETLNTELESLPNVLREAIPDIQTILKEVSTFCGNHLQDCPRICLYGEVCFGTQCAEVWYDAMVQCNSTAAELLESLES